MAGTLRSRLRWTPGIQEAKADPISRPMYVIILNRKSSLAATIQLRVQEEIGQGKDDTVLKGQLSPPICDHRRCFSGVVDGEEESVCVSF